MKETYEFDALRKWSSMNEEDILEIIDVDEMKDLSDTVKLLIPENEIANYPVNRENFLPVVKMMWKRYLDGSHELSEAILKASEYADKEENLLAIDVYSQFLGWCDMPFYRRITERQIDKLTDSIGTSQPELL